MLMRSQPVEPGTSLEPFKGKLSNKRGKNTKIFLSYRTAEGTISSTKAIRAKMGFHMVRVIRGRPIYLLKANRYRYRYRYRYIGIGILDIGIGIIGIGIGIGYEK